MGLSEELRRFISFVTLGTLLAYSFQLGGDGAKIRVANLPVKILT